MYFSNFFDLDIFFCKEDFGVCIVLSSVVLLFNEEYGDLVGDFGDFGYYEGSYVFFLVDDVGIDKFGELD